jgi:hypothetical protein
MDDNPTDEEDYTLDISADSISSSLQQDQRHHQQQSHNRSTSFGSFMHASYMEEEDSIVEVTNIEEDLMIVSSNILSEKQMNVENEDLKMVPVFFLDTFDVD